MTDLKCRMCGGKIEFEDGDKIGVCDSCGTKQILPKLDNEKKINLFDRADHFFRLNEYDRAMNLYEQIIVEDSKEALAYWSLVLCRYGVEYVEDPKTNKRIPTIHRLQVQSLLEDEDYKKALEFSDEESKEYYEKEGAEIERIRKEILELSKKETPYDVFICYKESDENGNRTKDSVLANELYYELEEAGYKVFFSRITLENQLGENYESCIYSALHSAKVMVVIGTRAENLKSVWVKNEWSRYLELIRKGEKKVLIPAYREMDPYDLPEEFSHLQAQDMSKLGFMQDLVRGIEKLCKEKREEKVVKEKIIIPEAADYQDETKIENLIKRIEIFLDYKEWEEANQYCEKVLDQDPENATVYLYKIMANVHVNKKEELANATMDFSTKTSYKKLVRYAEPELVEEINGYLKQIQSKNYQKKYEQAVEHINKNTVYDYEEAQKILDTILEYRDSEELSQMCKAKIREYNASSGYGPGTVLIFLLFFIVWLLFVIAIV